MDVRNLRIRREVENLRYEPAVDLGDVVKGTAPEFVQDPLSFFERTYLTESMKTLIIKTFMNILGFKRAAVGGRVYEVSSNLILLPSDLGGGKTHSLILLYHIFRLISEAKEASDVTDKISVLDKDVADFISENWKKIKEISPRVIVVDCKYSDLAPSPVRPIEIAGRRIKTLWGYLGYELGRYEYVRSADKEKVAPYADVILKVLNESKAVVLIDEIGRYYSQSGLKAATISTFLMNLAEAMSKYTIREVAVIISVPYEVKERRAEAKTGMKYVHEAGLLDAINEVLSRPNVEIIKPVGRQDLAEILRKRIFAHSEKELEKFAGAYISSELSKEYPSQVRRVLDSKNFWRTIRLTYPFHPKFLDILERLAYKLPYLQRTRDAIKISVQTVLALKEGLFQWLEKEINLIMPYHIPLFIEEVLDETVLRNAPREYKVFQLILKSNVVEPNNFNNLKRMKKKDFFEKVIASSLRNLKEEDAILSVKLASVIWLHSLVGLGLPMNMGDFPTTADLIYSVSPTELDVKRVLGLLRSVLPQLIVHGDPESDKARWFFTSIPSIEELIEILKKNVTDEMAKDKLAELLEWGLAGRRGRGRLPKGYKVKSIFDENIAVVKTAKSVSKEVLEAIDPALIVFADKVSVDELIGLLKGRNNIIVLAPHVSGVDKEEKLLPEDIKGIKELTGLRDNSLWEGLLEILRYYVAAESITEDHLRSFITEKIAGGEEYKLLMEDVMKLLNKKVESKKDYFYRHAWNLINRNYRKIYYYRLGEVRYEDGLVLESDRPIAPIVEAFLKDKGLIPAGFDRDNVLSIVRTYLGKDPQKEPINVGHLWGFMRTTDKANVPLISYKMFIEGIKDLVKSLDYAVKVRENILWKPVFSGRVEAEEKNEGEELLNMVREYLRTIGVSWDNVELVYWENVFDEWVKRVIDTTPRDKLLRVLDRRGNIIDIRDVLRGFDPKNTIKAGKLFYEKKKYIVEFEASLPEEMWEKREYSGTVSVNVENFDEKIEIKLMPDSGLEVEPKELEGRTPLTTNIKIKGEKAGKYNISIEIYGKGELLDKRVLSVSIKGEWIERDMVGIEGPIREGVRVLRVSTAELLGVPEIIRLAKSFKGRIEGKVRIQAKESNVTLSVETYDPRVLETLWGSINNLVRITKEGKVNIDVEYMLEEEPELAKIIDKVVNPDILKFRVKERVIR